MYAGFWRRVAAYLIDNIIVWVISCALMLGLWIFMKPDAAGGFGLIIIQLIISLGVPLVYYACFESSAAMATPGKMALGIIVCDMQGRRLSFWSAFGRNIAKWVSSLTVLIGYFMAGFTQRRQALHDIICNCLVVKKGADVPNLQPMPKKPAGQIILICICLLGIAPFLIGIMVAIALPQYFRAIEKSQATGAILTLASVAGAQERYMLTNANGSYSADWNAFDIDFPFTGINAREAQDDKFVYKLGSRSAVAERRVADKNKYTLTRCYASGTVCCAGNICAILDLPQKSPQDCCR
jgi:uncharacterized RDD family membrane protein YckC/Tfp pilus assembly protein PilE